MIKFNKSNEDTSKKYVINLNRTSKVVKGGTNFSISSLVVVGDGKGKASLGFGKAKEASDATRKATDKAVRGMHFVPMKSKRTVHYPLIGIFGSSKVLVFPANVGSGIKASKASRFIFEAIGFKDVTSKSLGSRNPINVAKATMVALLSAESPRFIDKKRGIKRFENKFEKFENKKE